MTSKRNYLTIAELEEFADITVTDEEEALDRIGMAEELIDAYVGPQDKFLSFVYPGEVTAVIGQNIYDTGNGTQLDVLDNFFLGAIIEIIGGTGVGQWRRIVSSDKSQKSVTYEGDLFSPNVDTTSVFKIYQAAKFPRFKDCSTNRANDLQLKAIPEAVKRATAAQVEFMIQQGDEYFKSDKSDFNSEIGNYSYEKGGSSQFSAASSKLKLLAPKARVLLTGIRNSGGRLVAENPTGL